MFKFIFSFILAHSVIFCQTYNVGDFVSIEDQNVELEVCYGGEGSVKLADYNGEFNGGDYNIIFIAMAVAS